MSILTDNPRSVKPADAEARYDAFRQTRADRCSIDHARRQEPTEFDLAEYARWLREAGGRAHAQDEPTPPEVLDRAEAWVSGDDDRVDDGPAHSTTVCDRQGRVISTDRPRYEARELETCWIVWDEMRRESAGLFESGRAARDRAEDLNAEDFEPVLIGTLPWFEAAAPCEHFDTPIRLAYSRKSPPRAVRTRHDELAYPNF